MDGPDRERAALVALLCRTGLDAPGVAQRLESHGAIAALDTELGHQTTLLPEDPEPLIDQAAQEIDRWQRRGLGLLTVLPDTDRDAYPPSLRTVHDRPALLFAAGDPQLARSPDGIAIVGSRHSSPAGTARAQRFAAEFAAAGHLVVSGLAQGVDAAAHRAAIDAGGRTIAVIGTGHDHSYPPANAALQDQIAREHLVLSPFWPSTPPNAEHFRRRNGVMSGLSLGTVIIEASARSGTRVQARLALAHGRPVFLHASLLEQSWARELASRPGVHVVEEPRQVIETLVRCATGPLTGPAE